MTATPIVTAVDLRRRFGEGEAAVDALDGVSLELPAGAFTAIMGPSGSGKSTLMHVLAGLDQPTSGTVTVDGIELGSLDDKKLTELRRDKVGFIFQSFNLLPVLTAAGEHRAAAEDRRPQGRRRLARPARSGPSASATASRTTRPSCPAASSSASPSRAR